MSLHSSGAAWIRRDGPSARDAPAVEGLALLNEPERSALRMLAEGHTAKTIATSLGWTESAVNERLREARRKTGIGSSRELARLLRAQENRDEQIGVAIAAEPGSSRTNAAPAPSARRKGPLLMSIAILAATAAAFSFSHQATSPGRAAEPPEAGAAVPADDLLGEMLAEPNPDPRQMHRRVRDEVRDPDWAPRMEESIRRRFAEVPDITLPVRVLCGRTICEVAGRFTTEDLEAVDRSMEIMQAEPFGADIEKLGLKQDFAMFGGGTFLRYWSRAER